MLQFTLGLIQVLLKSAMSYTAAKFYVLVFAAAVIYYVFPLRHRWTVLLCASILFYLALGCSAAMLAVFALSIGASCLSAVLISKAKTAGKEGRAKLLLIFGILVSAMPLIISKGGTLLFTSVIHRRLPAFIIPAGLSFYSMQIISYLADVYRGTAEAQKNILKYTLYVSFFPVIIQGPISRYGQLGNQLYEGNRFDGQKIRSALQLIVWGFFLKYMIADKAAVIVNTVFDNYSAYAGFYILIAGILYSLQLYTDFLSCVSISRGVAGIFGIELINNFNHPYFAESVKDFWRRWHISLSTWLRDYIYIPLGGSRRGKLRKYINIAVTFAVSGLWHGGGLRFIFWGMMHAGYQIAGEISEKPKNALLEKLSLPKGSALRRVWDSLATFFFIMLAWIIFRAESLTAGIKMIVSMFRLFNPWIFFDGSFGRMWQDPRETIILLVSVLILFAVSCMQEKGISIRGLINRRNFVFRWLVCLCAIWLIWIFGTYGFGYSSADFIYGGF